MNKIILTLIILTTAISGFAQIAVNTDGSLPDNSAMLDVKSSTGGLLIPRMTETQMNAIASPATGLMVFNTTANAFWYWDGSQWTEFRSGTPLWELTGTNIDVADTTYSVGIGTSNPSGRFEVATIKHSGTYGSNIATGGTASASEEYPGQTADLAFDNTSTTYWSNNDNLPAWIGYDLGIGNEKRVARYIVAYNSVVNNVNSPNDWTFEASNDGTTWTILDTQTGQGWTTTGIKTYDCSNITHYRFYRLNITDNKGTSNNFVSVYELQLKEEALTNNSTFVVNENGTIRISDGNEAAGKILVSDAAGIASWTDGVTVDGGGWTINGNLLSSTFDSIGIGTSAPGAELEVAGHIWQTNTGQSVFLGNEAGTMDDLTENLNVFIGEHSGHNNTSGNLNVAVGYYSFFSNTVGVGNTAIGSQALMNNTRGWSNSALGRSALSNNTEGYENTAIGQFALVQNTVGRNNVANGYSSLYWNTTGNGNVAIGSSALYYNTTGSDNIALGFLASNANNIGNNNVAIGRSALGYSNATSCVAIGISAASYGGNNIVAIGDSALHWNGFTNSDPLKSIQNTAVGSKSLYSNSFGSYNTSLGYQSLFSNTEGARNTAMGDSALYNNTSGDQNVALGFRALVSNTTGTKNTALGLAALSNLDGYTNSSAIGFNAQVSASNTITLGNGSVTTIGGYANWTNLSDGRFKTNVKENVAGLDFIVKLRPVTYKLDMDAIARFNNTSDNLRISESESLKAAEVQIGFIAQEVEAAAEALGFDFHGVDKPKNKESHYGLRYAEFVVPLVKAVQELNTEKQQLVEQLTAQQKLINALEKRLNNLEERIK